MLDQSVRLRQKCSLVAKPSEFLSTDVGNGETRQRVGKVKVKRRIKPPMCITKGDADFLCETLDRVFGEIETI